MSWLSDRAVRRLQEVAAWPAFADGRYTALRELGRGGMGAVYLAADEALGREVAVKVSSAAGEGSDLEARLGAEARVLARLEHPGIVPIHDAGRLADGRLFYVMKRVDGALLGDHLASVPERLDRLRIFERLCEPVAFAHARGFVHRDLKPENVMVGPFGEVLVLDWGVAKALADGADATHGSPAAVAADARVGRTSAAEPRDPALDGAAAGVPCTASGTVLGTRGYMAPEQASGGSAAVDARADVYALGAILLAMLTDAPPPEEPGAARAALERRRDLPRPLRAIALQALAARPEGRYPGALELAADVRRFRDGQPVSVYRENLAERAGRLYRRYRAAVLLVVAYLVMRALAQWWIAQRPAP
jgi:serine/threonine protein kinase